MIQIKESINNEKKILGQFDMAIKRAQQSAAGKVKYLAFQISPVKTGNMRSTLEANKPHFGDVSVGGEKAPYTIFVHNGTRKMAARPFLLQAFEQVRDWFVSELERI
jgi:HK97 gp10 family phage protein